MVKEAIRVRTHPAPPERPDFATWFGQLHHMKMDMSTHVYGRRLNALYSLRSNGIPARLKTIAGKIGIIIIGIELDENV